MSNYSVHGEMRSHLHEMYERINQIEPLLRNGRALGVWLEQITDRGFLRNIINIYALWLLSNPNHTLTYGDFPISEAAILKLAIFGQVQDTPKGLKRPATPSDMEAAVSARDRQGLQDAFRGFGSDNTLNLGAALDAVRLSVVACRREARDLLPANIATEKRTDVGGTTLQEELTITELGINGVPLADLLVTLRVNILVLYQPD